VLPDFDLSRKAMRLQADERMKELIDQRPVVERWKPASGKATNRDPNRQTSLKILLAPRSASPLPELLLEHLSSLLDAWYTEYGRSVIPLCANSMGASRRLFRKIDDEFVHENG
jgi:hypothetical protein